MRSDHVGTSIFGSNFTFYTYFAKKNKNAVKELGLNSMQFSQETRNLSKTVFSNKIHEYPSHTGDFQIHR